jgi:hypothetical protein
VEHVFLREVSSTGQLRTANPLEACVDAAHAVAAGPIVVADRPKTANLRRNRFDRWHSFLDGLDIAQFKMDAAAGAFAACLHAGLAGEHNDKVLPDL